MRVVAARHDGVAERVARSLDGGVVRVRLLGGASSYEARLLVVVHLRGLDVPDPRIVEVADYTREEVPLRDMVGIECDDQVVALEADLCEPGVVVAVLRPGFVRTGGLLILVKVLTAEMACSEPAA